MTGSVVLTARYVRKQQTHEGREETSLTHGLDVMCKT